MTVTAPTSNPTIAVAMTVSPTTTIPTSPGAILRGVGFNGACSDPRVKLVTNQKEINSVLPLDALTLQLNQ
jgi:hypothetical protein